ncbi:protein RD3-like isoform 1-T2 [Discoglossus pictus]
MFLAGLFGWNDPEGSVMKLAPKSSAELVTETLMLELNSHLKRSERQQRERLIEYRRVKSGVDYTWLASVPRQGIELSPGEQLELSETCSKISTSQCGPAILRFRRLMLEFEPEGAEIPRLFRSVLQDFATQEEEEQRQKQLELRWEKRRRAKSLATFTFKPPRLRVNPFQLEETYSSDTESELAASGRARSKSMPEITTTREEQ